MEALPIWERSTAMSPISKAEIRKAVFAARAASDREENARGDAGILENLRSLFAPVFFSCRTVYVYAGVRGEAKTEAICAFFAGRGYRLAFPRVVEKELAFFYVTAPEQLKKGAFGIPEPDGGCERAVCRTAPVIVPGVAFSPDGVRVGHGAGYYDRFLAEEPGHPAVAIGYDFQIFDAVPEEAHDRRMDWIVTPTRVFDCRNCKF